MSSYDRAFYDMHGLTTMRPNYFRYLSDAQKRKLHDDVESWLRGMTPPPEEVRPALVGMAANGLTKVDAEIILRDEGVLDDDAYIPATYWYGMRRLAESGSGLPSHVVARRMLLEETSVGAVQRGKALSKAFDAVAEAVYMGDHDRSATLIKLAEAIRQDEAVISAMDAGEDVEAAMSSGRPAPERVANTLSISALDELAHLIRGIDENATTD